MPDNAWQKTPWWLRMFGKPRYRCWVGVTSSLYCIDCGGWEYSHFKSVDEALSVLRGAAHDR